MSARDYVSNHKAAMCNCPRQCRHLSYNHDISQALLSNHLVKSARNKMRANVTLDEFRFDYCLLEVRKLYVFIYGHIHCKIHLQQSDAVVRLSKTRDLFSLSTGLTHPIILSTPI